MAVKVGINGFGRIGRNIMRAALGSKDIDFVAVNDLTSAATLAHLLKYDSVLGNLTLTSRRRAMASPSMARSSKCCRSRTPPSFRGRISALTSSSSRPASSPNRDGAAKHLAAGAKKVIITAPAKGPDITVVLGVNDDKYDPAKHQIISNASCTTNCLAPLAKVIHQMLRHQERVDDDDPLVHERPAAARSASQGFAPSTRRRVVDDPDDHGRRVGGR